MIPPFHLHSRSLDRNPNIRTIGTVCTLAQRIELLWGYLEACTCDRMNLYSNFPESFYIHPLFLYLPMPYTLTTTRNQVMQAPQPDPPPILIAGLESLAVGTRPTSLLPPPFPVKVLIRP